MVCTHGTELEGCIGGYPTCGVAVEHFRGFKITWEKTGGISETHEFGDCTTVFDATQTLSISEEIMYFSMDVDSNDIEGFAFRDYVQNQDVSCDSLPIYEAVYLPSCWHVAAANGLTWDASHRMGGRPIGFDLRMGLGPDWGHTDYGGVL